MSSEFIRPSTLGGIKRLAKSIKVDKGIKHVRALDAAAQAAGFENFRHAQNVLPDGHSHPRHPVFLTAYWRDKKSGERGRETLKLELDVLWSELIRPAQFENVRGLLRFSPEGPDHLARTVLADSQTSARDRVCHAARTLQFMRATGLQPSKSHSRAFPGGRSSNAVPGRDHDSVWYDRKTKRYLSVDEPYEESVLGRVGERQGWAQHHDFVIVKPSWPGMYYPEGGSRLYLIADAEKGIPLQPIAAALDRLAAPIVKEPWSGESGPSLPYFVSPGTIAQAEARALEPVRPRPKAVSGKRNTTGYVQTFVGPQRRPSAKMPIGAHEKVGGLLKSVLVASYRRKGVYNRVDTVRSELDEWAQREYSPIELPNDHFFDLYYHEESVSNVPMLSPMEKNQHVASLEEAKRTLLSHYPDCKPLRDLVGRLENALKSMQTWGREVA
jgi:hypothetical protein